jgi:hypothetical protein
MDTIQNYFTQSHFASMSQIIEEHRRRDRRREQEVDQAIFLSNIFIVCLIIGILLAGFLAVPHICPDNSERGKNTRLGLYFLLILTGGQIGWLFILLWIFNINICM